MSNANDTLIVIPLKHMVEQQTTKIQTDDLKFPYSQMVKDVNKVDPKDRLKTILSHQETIRELFLASNEKLSIFGNNIYFYYDDQQLTNFAAIVLNVTHIHYIEHKQFNVELLILCQNDEAKIVNVDSFSLNSHRWIEKLGASYWYKKIHYIQKAIKIMAEFAPTSKVYHYSGWAIDEPDTYIFGGQELCAKK